jgi:hypothetical protein
MENQARGMPEPEVGERQYNPRRFRTVDVQDLFEDARRQPVPQLAPPLCLPPPADAGRRYPRQRGAGVSPPGPCPR